MISPLVYSHADYVKQNDKNQETITSRFFPEQKTKKSFVLRHLSPVHKVLTGNLEAIIWTNCQFINSLQCGQGKCTWMYIWPSAWEFPKLCLWQPCLNKRIHVENWETDHLQHDLYMDTSYKFTLAWVFVSHACIRRTMNTFINDFICLQGFRANESTAYSIIMSQDHFHNSPQLHPWWHYFM